MDDEQWIHILLGDLRTIALPDNFDTAEEIREFAALAVAAFEEYKREAMT